VATDHVNNADPHVPQADHGEEGPVIISTSSSPSSSSPYNNHHNNNDYDDFPVIAEVARQSSSQ
jgi:hypothetical protein